MFDDIVARLRAKNLKECDQAAEEIEQLRKCLEDERNDLNEYVKIKDKVETHIELAEKENERLRAVNLTAFNLLRRVHGALNDAFLAGTEEREGGSARRQEARMKSGYELQKDICAALAEERQI